MRRHQIPTALALSAMLLLAATTGVLAKDGSIVTFDASLPSDPEPGTEITVGWTAETLGENGQLVPFNAEGMFVRLIPATGDPIEVVGVQSPLGHYVATVTVPDGGIVDVEAGLRGESCSGGTCQRSDLMFAIDESVTAAMAPGGPARIPGANAPQDAPADAGSPASPAGDLRPIAVIGLALAAAAIGGGWIVARERGRVRPIRTGSSRS
jgi:hypothetical protein